MLLPSQVSLSQWGTWDAVAGILLLSIQRLLEWLDLWSWISSASGLVERELQNCKHDRDRRSFSPFILIIHMTLLVSIRISIASEIAFSKLNWSSYPSLTRYHQWALWGSRRSYRTNSVLPAPYLVTTQQPDDRYYFLSVKLTQWHII